MRIKEISLCPGFLVSDTGIVISRQGRFMKGAKHSKGYTMVTIPGFGSTKIHNLVWFAFRGPKNGKQINHKDGNKLNNRIENLELVTAKENARHYWRQTNPLFEFYGTKMCIPEAMERFNCQVSDRVVNKRIKMGWPPEKAIETPKLKTWSRHCHAF